MGEGSNVYGRVQGGVPLEIAGFFVGVVLKQRIFPTSFYKYS